MAITWQCSKKADSNVLGEITDDFYEASVISDSVHSSLLGLIHANKIPSFKHLLADMDSLVFQEFPEEVKTSFQEGFYWAVPVTDDPHFPILDEHSQLTKKILDKGLITEKAYHQILESLKSAPLVFSETSSMTGYNYIGVLREHLP